MLMQSATYVWLSKPRIFRDDFMKICVYGAASPTIDESFIKTVEVLGEKMANYVNLNSIHILDELPHIGIGKVDLQKLEQESYRLSKRNN